MADEEDAIERAQSFLRKNRERVKRRQVIHVRNRINFHLIGLQNVFLLQIKNDSKIKSYFDQCFLLLSLSNSFDLPLGSSAH